MAWALQDRAPGFARFYKRGSKTHTRPGDIVTADVKRSLVEVEEANLASLPALPSVVAPTHRMFGILCLLFTAFGWAMNWVVLKFLMQEWPPLFTRGVAGTVAAIVLALVAVLTRQSLVVPRAAAPRLLVASFTNVFAWMGFTSLAMKWLSVGETALLCYTMPVWATLFAWPILGARPTWRSVTALLLALAGVVVLLAGHTPTSGNAEALGVLLALSAAICFGLGTVLNAAPAQLAPIASAAWQLGLGCFPMIVIGLIFEHLPTVALSPLGFDALAYMTVFAMGICYLTWFAALRRLPPSAAATGMLLVPLLGTLAAAAVFGEPLGPRQLISMALTLSGVMLALKRA
jgi:drug/metabolite transporter (DMT)-like permease